MSGHRPFSELTKHFTPERWERIAAIEAEMRAAMDGDPDGRRNFPDRALYTLDNLEVLRGMNSETVDLIATDPPFNTSRNRAGTAGFYVDKWKWGDTGILPDQWKWNEVHPIWLEQVKDENPALYEVIEAAGKCHGDDIAAFLCFLSVRLLEMHRILKPTGSLYLHCDHAANGYIRMALDAIFGAKNFRNEIVWHYNKWTNTASYFQRNHDTIFLYAKSAAATFNKQYGEPTKRQVELRKAGYNRGSKDGRPILRVYNRKKAAEQIRLAEAEGRTVYYVDEPLQGSPIPDVWTISSLNGQSSERTGSPDQKPLMLYERIINASSNLGDLVLDPFCGCATTLVAANNLGRYWVGIDRRADAAYHIANRLLELGINVNDFQAQQQALLQELQSHCQILDIAPVRTDGGDNYPHLAAVYTARRRPATMTRQQMMDILVEQWGVLCWGCGFAPPDAEHLELDHIDPASQGGSNELDNRCPLCAPCNKRKSNRLTLVALRQLNRKLRKWYGNPPIDQRVNIPLAREWAAQYLADRTRQSNLAVLAD